MAAVYASLLAKDINNNILAALPVEKMSAQALYNQRCVVQPGLISDPEEEVQHLGFYAGTAENSGMQFFSDLSEPRLHHQQFFHHHFYLLSKFLLRSIPIRKMASCFSSSPVQT